MRRENALLFPLLRMRIDFALDEFPDRAHQFAVLFGVEHDRSLTFSRRRMSCDEAGGFPPRDRSKGKVPELFASRGDRSARRRRSWRSRTARSTRARTA